MQGVFHKRSYTLRRFIKDIAITAQGLLVAGSRKKGPSIARKFAEEIFLSVTAVNKCRYCSWVHARLALEAGTTEREISGLLSSDFKNVEPAHVPALLFAQHYASTRGKPERESMKAFFRAYGMKDSRSIMNRIYMMMIGNLTGNTMDAFQHRLKGGIVRDGSLYFELLVFLFGCIVLKITRMKPGSIF